MKPAHFFVIIISIFGGLWILVNSATNLTAKSAPIATITPVPPTEKPKPSSTEVQIIKATYGPPFGFIPTEFKVKANLPIRLEVYAAEDGYGCMGSIMLPELLPNDVQEFTKGKTNIFEFTPPAPGVYQITCAMGIPHGEIIVK